LCFNVSEYCLIIFNCHGIHVQTPSQNLSILFCHIESIISNITCDVRTFKRYSVSDRKSTRLNSSHVSISYAVFCLKKKKHIIYAELSMKAISRGIYLFVQKTISLAVVVRTSLIAAPEANWMTLVGGFNLRVPPHAR